MTLFRWHRGSLNDSMKTVVEVRDKAHLVEVINRGLEWTGLVHAPDVIEVTYSSFDKRIGWDTYHVYINQGPMKGVCGMTDGPL
jgi:hypothetical protein